jgi:hypothetical protein
MTLPSTVMSTLSMAYSTYLIVTGVVPVTLKLAWKWPTVLFLGVHTTSALGSHSCACSSSRPHQLVGKHASGVTMLDRLTRLELLTGSGLEGGGGEGGLSGTPATGFRAAQPAPGLKPVGNRGSPVKMRGVLSGAARS